MRIGDSTHNPDFKPQNRPRFPKKALIGLCSAIALLALSSIAKVTMNSALTKMARLDNSLNLFYR